MEAIKMMDKVQEATSQKFEKSALHKALDRGISKGSKVVGSTDSAKPTTTKRDVRSRATGNILAGVFGDADGSDNPELFVKIKPKKQRRNTGICLSVMEMIPLTKYEVVDYFSAWGKSDRKERGSSMIGKVEIIQGASGKEIAETLVDSGFLKSSDMRRLKITSNNNGIRLVYLKAGMFPLFGLREAGSRIEYREAHRVEV